MKANVDLFTPSDEETSALNGKNSLASSTPPALYLRSENHPWKITGE